MTEERSTRRQALDDGDVKRLLDAAQRVVIVRGRSRRELAPSETVLDDLKGPTGNYRAPIVLSGGTLLVGFNADALNELL